MHVVLIASSRFPLAEPFAGGLESLTWNLALGLRSRGAEVTVFAGSGSDPRLGARELATRPLELSDTARRDVAMPAASWLTEHHAYLQLMLELQRRDDVDVVHNNSLHHLPVAMSAAAAAPMVTTLHTPPTPWLEPAIAIAGDPRSRYVAVSEHTRAAWRHAVGSEVVPNGVDVGRWTPGPGGNALAWVGRLVPEKAPHLAIDAARAAGRPLRLAGPVGDPGYVRTMVLPRLGDDVELLGHLGTDDLVTLFGTSAATLVTPVWDEPYGLVAAESLACGTPVVAFDRGGLGEFVRPAVGRLVPGGDVVAAAAAVPEAVALSRTACRDHAVRACSVDRMVEDYLKVYGAMLPLRGAA
ncbi:glycosyltransferase family 4 protein [Phycicoccus sp. HDW14]|uniref:glycosyltransferase n=1 Tax=Phycicoccus sp. HDW14 TaxID=2714941 RepID=UPI00140ADC22|nr:glycosyltransferase [Phycicoccus sp. HDW14]QIM21765.1 glycosyltransferase family 4 protein [Phycicoccus sp. HDW14]